MYIARGGNTPCQWDDPNLWFTKAGTRKEKLAKAACLACHERLACLESTLRFEERGGLQENVIYGGMNSGERAVLLKQRRPQPAPPDEQATA